jgi:TolB protein
MTAKIEPSNPSPSTRSRRRRTGWTIRISPAGVLLLVIINLLILGGLAYGIIRLMNWYDFTGQLNSATASETSSAVTTTSVVASVTSTSQPTASPTLQPTVTSTTESATVSPQPISTLTFTQGLIILAMDEGGNTHLFAYQPADNGEAQPLPLTRLTNGPWDDINPAFSPDGQTVAFASNRSGYWDIYLLDLNSGGITRLTDTLEYEGAPSWSPDNKWLVYESYTNENLEIEIQSVNPAEDSILLTNDPAADFSPAWSPDGRKIVFVSNRGGEDEIWLADLDKVEDQRFQNISQNPSCMVARR